MREVAKLYSAYKTIYQGDNILDAYYSFVANIIIENNIRSIDVNQIGAKLEEIYDLKIPSSLVREILNVGVKNNSITEYHGGYVVNWDNIRDFKFDESNFDKQWNQLLFSFSSFCKAIDVTIPSDKIEEIILNEINNSDEKLLLGEEKDGISENTYDYAWYKYIEEISSDSDLFSFISALSISNITKQALFYTSKTSTDYSGLNVYLDSPIVFALLGMDSEDRYNSYINLLSDMRQAKCNIFVLDHNYNEIDGIIHRAASWATSNYYDISKANNAARFFHDSNMTELEISEFCYNIESRLNDLGITIKETSYDINDNKFQEDENLLFEMVKEKYNSQGYYMTAEREESIRVDVRSIIMLYRERKGQVSTRIETSKHLMLTSNNAIANVSKNYESNRSINSGHIPACISVDLFGAILWLNSPTKIQEYQKKKLLADCYRYLQPSKKMIEGYVRSLDDARKAGDIDEKKFLFLRTHPVVLDSLMDITKGDYARFNPKTYLEVYEDIQAKSQKDYNDEVYAHEQTKMLMHKESENARKNLLEKDFKIQQLEKEINSLSTINANNKAILAKVLGYVFTIVFAVIPFAVVQVVVEILKAKYTDFSLMSIIHFVVLILLSSLLLFLYEKIRLACMVKAEKIVNKAVTR